MHYDLEAREYKMLLKPEHFSGHPTKEDANTFWTTRLRPIVRKALGTRRSKKSFDKPEERRVQYWDTPDCMFTRSDLALRRRRSVVSRTSDEVDELTLKFRMPDYFIVASTDMSVERKKDTKLEEDIAPLEVEDPDARENAVVLPAKRSTRSRFAMSSVVDIDERGLSKTGRALRTYFPTLDDIIDPGLSRSMKKPLKGGPKIVEYVFKGPQAILADELKADFTLTIWRFRDDGDNGAARVAEISFRYEIPDGEKAGTAARSALKLFVAMQEQLKDLVNPDHSSKTALALPSPCGKAPG